MIAYLFTNWRHSAEKKRKLAGLLRVAGYLTVVGAGCGLLSVRAARADVAQKSLLLGRQLGEQMRQVIGAGQHEVNHLTLNGEDFFLASSTSPDSTKLVLDRFAAMCEKDLAQSPSEWAALTKSRGSLELDSPGASSAGVIRAQTENDGTVLCFVKSKDAKPTLSEAAKAFADTGNLSSFGDLRYAYVKKADDGSSLVLTAWTHQRFSIKALTPEEGQDAVGADLPEGPRPPSSWRMLSVNAPGRGYALNIYRTGESPEKVAAVYDAEMKKLGYLGGEVPLEPAAEGSVVKNKVGRAYAKGGAMLTVGMHVEDGHTYVSTGFAGNQAGIRADRE